MPSPELQALCAVIRAQFGAKAEPSVEGSRAAFEKLAALLPIAPGTTFERAHAAPVEAEWVLPPEWDRAPPRSAPAPYTLVWLHGGGYVMGSLTTHRPLVSNIARAAGCRVLSVAYRLAPEHPFPAAAQDALAALRFVLETGCKPHHLAIGGDSAGGGLALAALVAMREASLPLPRAAVCLSPWVDLACSAASMTTHATLDPIVDPASLRRLARLYLGNADPRTPLASPIHADLTGLPPLLIQVGTREVLQDDARAAAARAEKAGVEVALEVVDEMIHVWHFFAGLIPEADQGIARVAAFLRSRWAPQQP